MFTEEGQPDAEGTAAVTEMNCFWTEKMTWLMQREWRDLKLTLSSIKPRTDESHCNHLLSHYQLIIWICKKKIIITVFLSIFTILATSLAAVADSIYCKYLLVHPTAGVCVAAFA